MTYAYARVSSKDQNLSRQINDFLSPNIPKSKIFCDKESGKNFNRFSYIKLFKKLKQGDLLIIKSIDRLGRNYKSIIEEWNKITNVIGADILVLDMPLLDTRTKSDNLIGKFISDIVLQVLSFVAENERNNIKQRQAEGIAIAKKKGVKFGRPKKKYSDEFIEIAKKFHNKELSLTEASSILGLSKQNFSYNYKKVFSNNK